MEEEKRATQNHQEFSYTEFEQPPLPVSWIERNGFSHWAVAFGWFIIGLIAFQAVTNLLLVILVFPYVSNPTDPNSFLEAIKNHIDLAFFANTTGQVLIIGLASYFLSKAHALKGKHHEFLRLKTAPNLFLNTTLSIFLLISSAGVVALLGWLNLNLFEWLLNIFPGLSIFKDAQTQMYEMIEALITSDYALIYGLLFVALVPTLFEEVMFRGYIQRALEKSWGIWAAIIVSALMFGAFHIQPSNFLGLSFLGFIFAYVTYISDSLIPAMILHFINNGGQVVYGSMNPEFLEQASSADIPLPWFMIILSVIVTTALLLLMHKMKMKSEAEHV